MTRFARILLTALAVPLLAAAAPTPSGLPVPRFVSLKFAEVNGRTGPSEAHPIRWVYHRQGLPVEVVAETENWRRVRDPEGALVWMHKRTLDSALTVLVRREARLLRDPEAGAEAEAVVEPGVVAQLRDCQGGWRRIGVGEHSGWLPADALWGADCENGRARGGLLAQAPRL